MNNNLLETLKELVESYRRNVKEAIEYWPSRRDFSSGHGFNRVLCTKNEISWTINALKEEGIDTSSLEQEISKIDKKSNSFIEENKEEYFKYLHKRLDAAIIRGYDNYLSYYIGGKFGGINQYEYEDMLDIRNGIEVIINELENNNFDVSKQKEKLNEIDEKFKSHTKDILLRYGEPSKWWKHRIPFPKNYWWRHLEDFCGIKSPTLEEVYKNRASIN